MKSDIICLQYMNTDWNCKEEKEIITLTRRRKQMESKQISLFVRWVFDLTLIFCIDDKLDKI